MSDTEKWIAEWLRLRSKLAESRGDVAGYRESVALWEAAEMIERGLARKEMGLS